MGPRCIYKEIKTSTYWGTTPEKTCVQSFVGTHVTSTVTLEDTFPRNCFSSDVDDWGVLQTPVFKPTSCTRVYFFYQNGRTLFRSSLEEITRETQYTITTPKDIMIRGITSEEGRECVRGFRGTEPFGLSYFRRATNRKLDSSSVNFSSRFLPPSPKSLWSYYSSYWPTRHLIELICFGLNCPLLPLFAMGVI